MELRWFCPASARMCHALEHVMSNDLEGTYLFQAHYWTRDSFRVFISNFVVTSVSEVIIRRVRCDCICVETACSMLVPGAWLQRH